MRHRLLLRSVMWLPKLGPSPVLISIAGYCAAEACGKDFATLQDLLPCLLEACGLQGGPLEPRSSSRNAYWHGASVDAAYGERVLYPSKCTESLHVSKGQVLDVYNSESFSSYHRNKTPFERNQRHINGRVRNYA